MRARHTVLPQPEGGAERDVLWSVRHNCGEAQLREALGDSRNDNLIFPVGLAGWEVPQGVPFEVLSANECGACGVLTRQWFEWQKRLVIL